MIRAALKFIHLLIVVTRGKWWNDVIICALPVNVNPHFDAFFMKAGCGGLRKQPEQYQTTKRGWKVYGTRNHWRKIFKPYLIDGWALNLRPDAHICRMETKHFRQFNIIFNSSSIYLFWVSFMKRKIVDKSQSRLLWRDYFESCLEWIELQH